MFLGNWPGKNLSPKLSFPPLVGMLLYRWQGYSSESLLFGIAFAKNKEALWWAISAATMAIGSLTLAVVFGLARSGDPHGVTWTFALYTALAVLATFQIKHHVVAWSASGLLLLTLVQGIVFRFANSHTLEHPWVLAFLIHATIVIAGYLVVWKWSKSNLGRLGSIFFSSSLVTSTVSFDCLNREGIRSIVERFGEVSSMASFYLASNCLSVSAWSRFYCVPSRTNGCTCLWCNSWCLYSSMVPRSQSSLA